MPSNNAANNGSQIASAASATGTFFYSAQQSNQDGEYDYDSQQQQQLGRSSVPSILHPASRFHNGTSDSFGGDVVCLKNGGSSTANEESPLLNLHNFVHGTEQFFHAFSPAVQSTGAAPNSAIQSSSSNNSNDVQQSQTQQADATGNNDDNNHKMNKSGRSSSSNNDVIEAEPDGGRSSSSTNNVQQQEKNPAAAAAAVTSSSSSSSAEFLELESGGSAKKANKAPPFVSYPPGPTNAKQQTTQFTSLSPSGGSSNNSNASSNPRSVKLAGAASLAAYRSHPYAAAATAGSSSTSATSSSSGNGQQQQSIFSYESGNSNVSPTHEQMNNAAAAIANGFFHPAYRDFEHLQQQQQQQQQFLASSQQPPTPNWQASSSSAAGYTTRPLLTQPPLSMLPSPSGVSPGAGAMSTGSYPGSSNVLPYLYLLNRDLWVKFNRHGNEMIVTKQGRRMFPSLIVKIAGLQPHAAYHLYVEVVQADPHQWKFTNGRWMANGIADIDPPEQPTPNAIYHHPESPCSGAEWMSRKIDFCSMKLTNDRTTTSGHIVLNSMRKYVPRIHVIEMPLGAGGILSPNQLMLGPNGLVDSKTPHWTFTFPETAFIAVTTYQNPVVTQLKIENNPFAKGFRDSDRDSGRPTVVVTTTSSTVATAATATTTAATDGSSNSSHHHNSSHNHHNHNNHHSSRQHQSSRPSPPPNGPATRNNTSSAGGGSSDSSSPLSTSELRLQQQQQAQVSALSSYIRHSQTPSSAQLQPGGELLLAGDHNGSLFSAAAAHLGPLTPNTSHSMMANWAQSAPLCSSGGWSAQAMLEAAAPPPPTAVQLAQLNQHASLGIYSPISPASVAVASSSLGLFGAGMTGHPSSSPATVFTFGQNTPPGSGSNVIWPPSMQSAYSTVPGSNQFAILGPGANNSGNSSSCALAAVTPPTGSSMAATSMMQSVINAADPTSAFSHLAWADGGASFYQ